MAQKMRIAVRKDDGGYFYQLRDSDQQITSPQIPVVFIIEEQESEKDLNITDKIAKLLERAREECKRRGIPDDFLQ